MLTITKFEINMFAENCYVLADQSTGEAAVVDPGLFYSEEKQAFGRFITENKLHLTQIINTHLHLDHCFGADYVKSAYGVALAANPADASLGAQLADQSQRFGIKTDFPAVTIDVELHDGDIINIGASRLEVLQIPGHSPGGIALYCAEQRFVLTGDSLFQGSIGRTDLEGGDQNALISNICSKLMSLPDDVTVLPGHGPTTTIGAERKNNPYLRCGNLVR